MSIEYSMVNRQRKKQVLELRELLSTMYNECLGKLHQFEGTHPDLGNIIEDKIFQAEHSDFFRPQSYDEEDMVIGIASGSGFHWGSNFQDKDSVIEFLDTHAEYFIENEYGQEIPLKDFLKNL